MDHPRKRRLQMLLRAALALAGVVVIGSQLQLQDSVTLGSSGATLHGRVVEKDGALWLTPDGTTLSLGSVELPPVTAGGLRVQYGLWSIWDRGAQALMAAGIAVFLLVPLCQAVRLRMMLATHDIRMTFAESLRVTLAGNFLNFAAPFGSTAGDVYKAWHASRQTDRRTEAATIVFVDRLLGLMVLLVSVAAVALLSPADSPLGALASYTLTLLSIGVAALVCYVSPPIRRAGWLRRWVARLPKRDQLVRIDRAVLHLLRRPGELARAVAVTLLLQGAAAGAFALLASGLGLRLNEAGVFPVYAYFSAGELVRALPGPPQGLGTMELAYGFLFARFGTSSQIVCAALGLRLMNLFWALPGALVVWRGVGRVSPAAPAMSTSPRRAALPVGSA